MEMALLPYRIYDLPWATGWEQDQRFLRIQKRSLGVVLILSLVLSVLPLPELDPAEFQEIPARFAKLVLERQVPLPVVVQEDRERAPEPESEPLVEQQQAPELIPEPPPDRVELTQRARRRASVAGLLPFAAELASLRDNAALRNLAETDIMNAPASAAPTTDRSLVTSAATGTSGGINTDSFSRDTGGGGLEARTTTRIASPIEAIGPAGGSASRTGASNRASRSREEIEVVFDRNKGAIFALYNRALRQNPALQGKLVLRLTIEPDGTVSSCDVISSELGDLELEQKLAQRVLLFQFEPKDVEVMTTTKPIDFFPA